MLHICYVPTVEVTGPFIVVAAIINNDTYVRTYNNLITC